MGNNLVPKNRVSVVLNVERILWDPGLPEYEKRVTAWGWFAAAVVVKSEDGKGGKTGAPECHGGPTVQQVKNGR